ncbi:MAG: sel1 repeat family protein [Gammaproteobacteria bacterium]|nr:sel1 repeat family protein [Gammaproteobacteria bacterium]MCP4879841.1 sel1 repeat family protein [Gammaproteobacteria bacterium]MDP6166756.1 hypothetical protein [Gammaproteobacteria bacterium]
MLTIKTARSIFLLTGMIYASCSFADMQAAMQAVNNNDYATAIELLTPEADNGEAEAQYQMGLLYADGLGTEANQDTAAEYMQMAASQEHEEAITWLTDRDIEPEGNPEDDC